MPRSRPETQPRSGPETQPRSGVGTQPRRGHATGVLGWGLALTLVCVPGAIHFSLMLVFLLGGMLLLESGPAGRRRIYLPRGRRA